MFFISTVDGCVLIFFLDLNGNSKEACYTRHTLMRIWEEWPEKPNRDWMTSSELKGCQKTKGSSCICLRQNNTKCVEGKRTSIIVLHTEEYGSKKSGSRRFSWTKWSWKASEQEECAVCLESFRVGETLIHLPCAHRFHDRCLKPWLENNSYCPCCRTTILPL
ncbi:putative RING finger protein P32A8.03c [Glycine max]|nr:putative RING finger protein P32A8.03c [Glycine max]